MPIPFAAGIFLGGYTGLFAVPFALVHTARAVNCEFPDADDLIDLEECSGTDEETEISDDNNQPIESANDGVDHNNRTPLKSPTPSDPDTELRGPLIVEWEEIDD